jgi:cytochrome c-type biogenesis protein CcsB
MSEETFAHVSNLVIPTATVIYVLAMVAHAMEWATGRAAKTSVQTDAVQYADALVTAGASGPATSGVEDVVVRTDTAAEKAAAASRIGLLLTWFAFVLHLAGVLTRGLAAGRVPWGNMYEFSITSSLAVAVVYLAFVHRYKMQWLGLGVTLVISAVLGLATLLLYTPAGPLVPALHSYWLVIHVSAAAISGGAFTVGALISILYLVKSRAERRVLAGGTMSPSLKRLPSAEAMDGTAYKVLAFAFPLWTFGVLVAGPIWAEYAWGRYWGWDPKEVWALVTWVVYAAYLHARATAGWRGRPAAMIAIVGWLVFLFDFVGVNLLVSGLHSYAGV